MTRNEKAVAQIMNKGIEAFIENEVVYIRCNDVSFEISVFETKYQAKCYDEDNSDEEDESLA